MTTDQQVTVTGLIIALVEGAYRSVGRAVDGLTEEQLYHQPSSDTNSIAWLAWHMNRWKDRQSAAMASEAEVWTSGGWAGRFGIAPERTGMGDTSEQVTAFRPPRDLLFGYVDTAHQAFVERVGRLGPADLDRVVPYMPTVEPRPIWRVFQSVCSDVGSHTGKIAYLRGLITAKGWSAA